MDYGNYGPVFIANEGENDRNIWQLRLYLHLIFGKIAVVLHFWDPKQTIILNFMWLKDIYRADGVDGPQEMEIN